MTAGMSTDAPLAAGGFSAWLAGMDRALRGDADSDVPCGSCTACCTSSQFVHIGPDEADTLAHIPAQLLFPAPRLPEGHVLLGYDELGHCPMLIGGACSIYEHRPRTCRTYDCRVFPAAGVEPEEQPDIAGRTRRWQFDFADPADEIEHEAVRAAVRFVAERGDLLPAGTAPTSAVQRAVLAIELHGAFLRRDGASGAMAVVEPEPEAIKAVFGSRRDPPVREV
ncbi:MAG: YkgJ family cysteine cluster protein [Acidimicrobiales bacterium]